MARLKHPIIKEVSLAINPVNRKKFLFKKEEDIMDEETLTNVNEKLNELLGITDEEAKEFEKGATTIKAIEKKVMKLSEQKVTQQNLTKTVQGIVDTLAKITDYLKAQKESTKTKANYGYPAPKKKDEDISETTKESPKVEKDEPKKEEVTKDEPKEEEEETFDIKEIAKLVKEGLNNEQSE